MLPKDPYMLLSFVNLKLRDEYDSLDALCDDLNVSFTEIVLTLDSIGYLYNESQNQFKNK